MLFSPIYNTTGLLQRIPDDLIWQCGGCNNTLELSWQPSRALGLLPLPGRVSPATDSLNAPLYYNVSFLFTHRRLLVFYYFLINIHPFEYKKNHPSVGRCGDFLVVSRRKMSPRARLSHRAHEPLPVMAQQHFTAQCSPLSVKKPFWDKRTAEKPLSKCSLHSLSPKRLFLDKGKQINLQDFSPNKILLLV